MDSRDRRFVAALVAASALTQLWLMRRYFGFLTGDDVEVLAEAMRVAVGFRYRAWDIRNVFVPHTFVAPAIWLAAKLGVHDLPAAATLPFIAASSATIIATHRLALRWSDDPLAARIAALLIATHWLPLGFGATVYPRVIATLCVTSATLVVIPSVARDPGGRARHEWPFPVTPPAQVPRYARDDMRALLAGALLAIAVADRFSEAIFLLPLCLLARRRAVHVLAGFAASAALVIGLHDWYTWGAPFSSAIKFTRLTLLQPDFASRLKYQSPLWYLETLPRWCAVTLLPLLWFARRRVHAWLFVLIPLAALSLIRHKELRYLHGLIPFLAILGGIGAAILWRQRRAIAATLVALTIAMQLYGLRFLAKKSMPAVMAAQSLGADPRINTVVLSQLWAYGDRVYFGDRMNVRDVGTPPQNLERNLANADAATLYESDVDVATRDTLQHNGFVQKQRFDDGPARAVAVYVRASSGTSDRARR